MLKLWTHCAVAFACAGGLVSGATLSGAQEPDTKQEQTEKPKRKRLSPEERLLKTIKVAIDGKPVMRSQAAERLIGQGIEARSAVLARLAEAGGGGPEDVEFVSWYDLGPDFLGAAAHLTQADLGGADTSTTRSAAVRSAMWRAAAHPQFPWRAAIVAGLGASASAAEANRFVHWVSDPLAAVRLASLKGLAQLDRDMLIVLLSPALQGERDNQVRRAIAELLLEKGKRGAAWAWFEDLAHDDKFFDQPVGMVARLEAAKLFAKHFPEAPAVPAATNPTEDSAVQARAALSDYLRANGIRPLTPAPASSPIEPTGKELFGVELRSCRSGEFFLRWTDTDQLWVGRIDPFVIALPEGSAASLLQQAISTAEAMDGKLLTGKAGCDLESYYLPVEGKKRPRRFLVSKGPTPVPGLRPEPLNQFVSHWLKTLPEDPQASSNDERRRQLRTRVIAALNEIGGNIP